MGGDENAPWSATRAGKHGATKGNATVTATLEAARKAGAADGANDAGLCPACATVWPSRQPSTLGEPSVRLSSCLSAELSGTRPSIRGSEWGAVAAATQL